MFGYFIRYVTAPEESFLEFKASSSEGPLGVITALIDSGVAAIEAVAEEQKEAMDNALGRAYR